MSISTFFLEASPIMFNPLFIKTPLTSQQGYGHVEGDKEISRKSDG